MHIRESTDEDAAAVAVLITQLGYPTTAEEMRSRLRRIAADAQYVSLVALEHTEVVGFLGMAFGLHYEYDTRSTKLRYCCWPLDTGFSSVRS